MTASLRETARAVYGDDLIEDRFPTCQAGYEEAGVTAQFRVYDGVGHTPGPAFEDIVEFHRRSIEGESVDEFGEPLGLDAHLSWTPENPGVGEKVEFDATATQPGRSEVLVYAWKFGDGETAIGPTVTHAFAEEQLYTVRVRAVDGFGRSDTVELGLGAGDVSNEGIPYEPTETPTPTTESPTNRSGTNQSNESPQTTEGAGPGFGLGAAVTGLGGAAYLLTRHRRASESEGDEE